MAVSIEEWQLLGCLEVEPHLLDPDNPWVYNDALYTVVQGDLRLHFSLAPSFQDVRIILQFSGTTVYELNAVGVVDVLYRKDDDGEQIDVILSKSDRIVLRAKPRIVLFHKSATPPQGTPDS